MKRISTYKRQINTTIGVASVCLLSYTVATIAGPTAWQQVKNNNHIIDTQKAGSGNPMDEGEVTIDFYGHAAFKMTSPSGMTMLFDPWRNDPSGAWGLWFPKEFPEVEVDTILSTHAHFDHDATERPNGQMILDRMTGTYQFSDVKITGLADKHQCEAPGWYSWTDAMPEFGQPQCPPDNYHHLDNNIYLLETGGMRIAIWGDNRQNPGEHVWAALTDIDVLVLPVDASQHILSYAQADSIVERIKPHVIIPEHYLTKGASITLTTLGTAEEWTVKQANHTLLDSATLKLTADSVSGMDRHVMYFGANHLKE
ncbi:MAG: L-ascorbate metabolism protein UlaG (beta-lactamase superfamily) [Gammaproteobacteria bacterium]|jgi:L-ascorbate metabolism protein UlaG (beta-lactamase superfamily)